MTRGDQVVIKWCKLDISITLFCLGYHYVLKGKVD